MPIVYRTTDGAKWGTGKGSNLTPTEVDNNFWELVERLVELEENPPTAVGISNIQVVGTTMMIYLSDGTEFGPYTLPVAQMDWRGDWQPETQYYETNLVKVNGRGLYFVRLDHISDTTFNPEATDGLGNPLYGLTFGEDTYVYDFGFFYPGVPGFGIAVGATMAAHMPAHSFYIPANAPSCIAKLDVAPTAELVFDLQKNGDVIGSITFDAADPLGIFDFPDDVQFDAGDIFRLMGPAALDATAEELVVTIAAVRGEIPV